MTLTPNTQITQENVGLLKAGDVVMVVAPNHGEWTGGEWPVTKVGNVWADLKHPRFEEGMFFAQELVFVRPALSPPAEGEGSCDDQFAQASAAAANIGYMLVPEPDHPDCPHKESGMAKILRDQAADISRYLNPSHATPTPALVDWERVGPKLAEAGREMLALVLVKYGNLDADVNAAVARAQTALAAAQPEAK